MPLVLEEAGKIRLEFSPPGKSQYNYKEYSADAH